jgi:DNA polymerase III epsilon subunit-like protein
MEIPDRYIVADLETTGFGKKAHIVQVGWCAIEKGEIADRGAVPMKCPNGVEIAEGATGVHGYTWEKLAEVGKEPKQVLEAFSGYLQAYRTIVGFNFVRFDAAVMNRNLDRYSLPPIPFRSNHLVIDVGIVVKASLMNQPRGSEEAIWDYTARMAKAHYKGKWNLDVCMEMFSIAGSRDLHDAGDDCYRTHLLYEVLRNNGRIQGMLWP